MFEKLFKRDPNKPIYKYSIDRFVLNNRHMIIDKKYGKAYFQLNPLRYEIWDNYVYDKTLEKLANRKVEYSRYELIEDNKILDKVTKKEFDNIEDIVELLNSQNQFIDNTKDVIDDEIHITRRNRRYAGEIGDEEEVNYNNRQQEVLERIQQELFFKED